MEPRFSINDRILLNIEGRYPLSGTVREIELHRSGESYFYKVWVNFDGTEFQYRHIESDLRPMVTPIIPIGTLVEANLPNQRPIYGKIVEHTVFPSTSGPTIYAHVQIDGKDIVYKYQERFLSIR